MRAPSTLLQPPNPLPISLSLSPPHPHSSSLSAFPSASCDKPALTHRGITEGRYRKGGHALEHERARHGRLGVQDALGTSSSTTCLWWRQILIKKGLQKGLALCDM